MPEQNFIKASSKVHLVMVGILLLSTVIAAGTVVVKMTGTVSTNANVPATVARPRVTAAAPTHVAPACPLTQTLGAVSPVGGWFRYQDAASCFTLDYPKGWRIESNDAAVHLWSPQNPHRDDGSYWNADIVIERPYDEGDAGAMRDALVRKGWTDAGRGTLIGPWTTAVAGDGSALATRTQERRVFTGRGAFHIDLVNTAGDAQAKLLEKIADTFTAQ